MTRAEHAGERAAAGLTARLTQRLRFEAGGPDEFVGYAPPQPPRIFGGELAAQALAAANATVTSDRVAHALQVNYLAPGDPAQPLHHRIERVRDGRSFSTRVVRVRNGGRQLLTAHVGYHIAESGLDHQLDMPSVPLPESLPDIAEADGHAWTRWAEQDPDLDMRPIPPDHADPTGRRRFWCRVPADADDTADDPRLQTALMAYLSDVTMVASIRLPHEPPSAKQYLMSTLSHSVYFHRPVRTDDWLLIDHYSPAAAGGRGVSFAHVYRRDGSLVTSAVQEGLIRPLPEDYL